MFNGLMQIPGRRNRRSALLRIRELCSPGAPLIFTTHDRDRSSEDAGYWEAEARRWAEGRQDGAREFGDRQFEDERPRVHPYPDGRRFSPALQGADTPLPRGPSRPSNSASRIWRPI